MDPSSASSATHAPRTEGELAARQVKFGSRLAVIGLALTSLLIVFGFVRWYLDRNSGTGQTGIASPIDPSIPELVLLPLILGSTLIAIGALLAFKGQRRLRSARPQGHSIGPQDDLGPQLDAQPQDDLRSLDDK